MWVFDDRGQIKTKIRTDYSRHHALLDWTGDGLDEIMVAQARALLMVRGGSWRDLPRTPAMMPTERRDWR